jgi:asparagine synthase (glutamine-hydrolysing)
VVLSGDGGDELFGGYPKYRADRLIRILPPARAALRLAAAVGSTRRSHRQLARAVETMTIRDPTVRWSSWFRTFSATELERLLVPHLARGATPGLLAAPLARLLAPYRHLEPGRRMLLGDLLTYLPDNMLLRSDKVLMGASVEGRAPLLDRRIVEAAGALPAAELTSFRSPKRILRRALEDLLPDEVKRAPKRGFPVPVAGMLAGPHSELPARLLLSERALDRGFFRPDVLRRLVEGRERATADRERKLFVLISLELWLRTNVDAVTTSAPESLQALLAA